MEGNRHRRSRCLRRWAAGRQGSDQSNTPAATDHRTDSDPPHARRGRMSTRAARTHLSGDAALAAAPIPAGCVSSKTERTRKPPYCQAAPVTPRHPIEAILREPAGRPARCTGACCRTPCSGPLKVVERCCRPAQVSAHRRRVGAKVGQDSEWITDGGAGTFDNLCSRQGDRLSGADPAARS